MLVFLPSAAEALAIIKLAIALSRSPEKTMKFLPLCAVTCCSSAVGSLFCIRAVEIPFLLSMPRKALPVLRQ